MGVRYVRIYMEHLDVLDDLTDAQRGKVIKALMHYALGEEPHDLGPLESAVYKCLRPLVDRDKLAYDAKVEGGEKGRKARRTKSETAVPHDEMAMPTDGMAMQNMAMPNDEMAMQESEMAMPTDGMAISTQFNSTQLNSSQINSTQVKSTQNKTSQVSSSSSQITADAEPAAPEATTTTTTPPRENDVIAYFVAAGSHPAQAVQFIIYNNARGWMQGNTRIVDWRPIADRWIAQQAQHDSKGQGQTKAKTSYERNMEALDQAVANLEGRTQ